MNDFQQIFFDNPAMLLVCDASGRIREINHSCAEEIGYSPEEVSGRSIDEIINCDVSSDDSLWWYRYLWDQGKVSDIEYRLCRKDGRILDVLLSGVVMKNQAGEKAFLAVIRNVTDLKQIHTKLYQTAESAEQAGKAKSEFLSRISHDMRTPLNAILGFGQLLELSKKPPLSPDQLDLTQEILIAGQHLLELVNDLLDTARIEAGKLQLSVEEVDLSAVVRECLTIVLPIAGQRGIEIPDDAPPSSVTRVLADEGRLKQVLLNLLSNAVKYNSEGGRVRISVEPVDDTFVRLSVHDTGPGIPENALDTVFKPFSRLEQEQTEEGSGMGLTIAKKLTELMGGRIGLESRAGEGSCFWIELCVAD